jgi:hypothetical protein
MRDKIIQLVISPETSSEYECQYALCKDGTLWARYRKWEREMWLWTKWEQQETPQSEEIDN